MADSVAKWNENCIKYFLLFSEAGAKALIQTLRWLYVGPTLLEDHLVDLVQKWPQKFYSIEIRALESLKGGQITVEELSWPLLLKVTLQLCCLPSENELPIWTPQLCQPENRSELETLLLSLKDEHRNLRSLCKNNENVSHSLVLSKSEKLKDLLTSVLQKAGLNICGKERDDAIISIRGDIDLICYREKCDFSNQIYSKYVILNDFEDIQTDLRDSLRGYSIPELTSQDNKKAKVPLEDILSDHNTRAIVVLGDPGIGKSSLTKFVFNSWKCGGLMSSINDLSDFDVAFRVECKQIRNKEIFHFFQDCFPISSFLLSNLSKMMKFLEGLRILWIMDGYDECTAEFKSVLTSLTKRIHESHKVLITSRPNRHETLKTSLSGLSQFTLSIGKLNESNIDEITKHYIIEECSWNLFKEGLTSLSNSEKFCLQVPLNLSLYIELWLHDSNLVKEPFSAMTLYRKSTNLNLRKLIDKVSCYASPPTSTGGGVEDKVQRWFYESLCKQSFISAMRWDNTFGSKTFEILEKDARQSGLVASDLLSALLSETIGRDGKKHYDFKHCEQQYVLASMFLRNMKIYDN